MSVSFVLNLHWLHFLVWRLVYNLGSDLSVMKQQQQQNLFNVSARHTKITWRQTSVLNRSGFVVKWGFPPDRSIKLNDNNGTNISCSWYVLVARGFFPLNYSCFSTFRKKLIMFIPNVMKSWKIEFEIRLCSLVMMHLIVYTELWKNNHDIWWMVYLSIWLSARLSPLYVYYIFLINTLQLRYVRLARHQQYYISEREWKLIDRPKEQIFFQSDW